MMADTNISSLSFSFPSILYDNIVRLVRKIMNQCVLDIEITRVNMMFIANAQW